MKMVGKLKNQFFVINTHTTGTGYKGLLQIHTLAPARKQIHLKQNIYIIKSLKRT